MAKNSFDVKKLLVLFVALLAIFFGSKLFGGKKERSFRSELTNIDTAKIDVVKVYPKAANGTEITLERNGNTWHVIKDGFRAPTNETAVQGMLREIQNIKVSRVAATNEDKWVQYEVADTGSTKVKVFAGKKELASLVVGRFSFNQQAQSISTFVRLEEEPETYVTQAFLSMTFNRDFDSWRDKTFLTIDKTNLSKVNFSGAMALDLQKTTGQWVANGSTPVDSVKMDSYLGGLANLSGSAFLDGFSSDAPMATISMEGNNMSPITVNCYSNPNGGFIFNSSLNPKAYFESDSSGLYKSLFGDLDQILSTGE